MINKISNTPNFNSSCRKNNSDITFGMITHKTRTLTPFDEITELRQLYNRIKNDEFKPTMRIGDRMFFWAHNNNQKIYAPELAQVQIDRLGNIQILELNGQIIKLDDWNGYNGYTKKSVFSQNKQDPTLKSLWQLIVAELKNRIGC